MTEPSPLPANIKANPRLSRWLRFDPAGFVELSPGKIEIGQGIVTALAQIAADELDVGLDRIRMMPVITGTSPNEGTTSGSLSVEQSGSAVRYAAAQARAIYLGAAAQRLGVAPDSLAVDDGTIVGPGNLRTSYWELADDSLLAREAAPGAAAKPPEARRVAGTPSPRLDLPDKVYGRPRFVHDLDVPGLLHGRVLKPAGPWAKLQSLDESAARALPGVIAVVRNGSFVGVVADTEAAAEAGLAALRKGAVWAGGDRLPPEADLAAWLKSQPAETTIAEERKAARPAPAARTVRRQYSRPFIAHASMAPSCAIAQWTGADKLQVWSHCQGVYNLRADIGLALGMAVENIVVQHVEGSGCYGHNGADDVAFDAVLLARAAQGRPVRLQWSREDELAWAPMGAAMAIDIQADLDAAGDIVGWRGDVWSNGHVSRPGRMPIPTVLAASQLATPSERFIAFNPPMAMGGGAERNAIPYYDFPSLRVTCHRLLTMPIRTSALRTLGAFANVFAIESFMDELAAERGEDPLAFRLRYLKDPRARAVLEAAARRAGWSSWVKRDGTGHGIAFGRYK
ncbi:MAG TPA: molybdopterin cofactor-binding domain-containing protein, partial [Hyphomicrobiaceae bacterium]|nr:molybdopterin cofactor-binding domain-containing protein [Hyphomicrobiaceae bacterium]